MIFIALGSNMPGPAGESPEEVLRAAVAALEARGIVLALRSSVWLTAPVPKSDQALYRNAVVATQSAPAPAELMRDLHEIERQFGRVRGEKNAPRSLDLDILDYRGRAEHCSGGPILPHPRMHERGFVLFPLQEIAPEWAHPVLGKNVSQMILELSTEARDDVRRAGAI